MLYIVALAVGAYAGWYAERINLTARVAAKFRSFFDMNG